MANRRAGLLGIAVAVAGLAGGSALAAEPTDSADGVTIEDIHVGGGPLYLSTDAEVDALEAELGMEMPAGYREYVTRLGHGDLCGFRVIPPGQVLSGLDRHRGTMAIDWSWDAEDGPFGQDQAMTSVPIADGWLGLTVAWPAHPDHLYLLPKVDPWVIARDADLLQLVEWVCRSDPDVAPGAALVFQPSEPFALEQTALPPAIEPDTAPPDLSRPPREVLEAYLRELAAVEAWAIDEAGGPDALSADLVAEEVMNRVDREFEARMAGVHRRYASRLVALAKRGSTAWMVPSEHSGYEIIDEEPVAEDHVGILARHRDGRLRRSTLERGADGWRVIKEEHGYDPDA
jgi:hypothetical protein